MQASICVPPFCYGTTVNASATMSNGNTDSTYASVREQSGIYAGQGGFDVNVKGNTDLKGGVLASTADPSKNNLTTGTLTTSDIENKAEYSSSSSQFAASFSAGKSVPASDPNLGPVQGAHTDLLGNLNLAGNLANSAMASAAGNAQKPIEGNASGTTKSAIAAGTVTITDGAAQQAKTGKTVDETLASLNRDTESANQSVDKIFDAQKVKDEQALKQLTGQTIQQAAPIIYNQVGNALDGQPEYVKVAVHGLVGGLVSKALGGDFGTGAVGVAASTAAIALLDENLGSLGVDPATKDKLLQLVGTAVAGAIGGNAAAGTAGMADAYNRQMHPDEEKWIRANAKRFAAEQGITDEEKAIERLSLQVVKQTDYLWRAQLSDGDDAAAKAFLGTTKQTFTNELGQQQQLFTATDQQLFRPEMFADTADPKFYQRFVQSGISRTLNTGLVKELKDSGIDIKNGAVELAKAAKDNPGLVLSAVWDAVKGLPSAVVDSFRESGHAIGEGAAVGLNKDLSDKLNAIYGADVSGYQQALLAIRITVALTGATTAAKSAAGMSEVVAAVVAKKLDTAALDALLGSGGLLDKSGQPLLDMSQLSNAQKSIMGDLFGANTVKQIVPNGQKLARIPAIGEQGIDDLYKVRRPDVDYVIIENKFVGNDTTTGAQRLGSTADGKQGSASWINGSDRLDRSVGEDVALDVRLAVNAGRTETWVVTTRVDGSTEIQVLDAAGKPKAVDTSKLLLPGRNAVGAKS
ncbi:MAG: hypothetical protein JO278_10300 [Dyella sp.]|nr:hypothetical protein [Dyella sp.]